jgi:serine/threonine protein kinase
MHEPIEPAVENGEGANRQPVLPTFAPRQANLPGFQPPAQGTVITARASGHTYTVGGLLDQGAFGRVYACNDDWNNELVLKVIPSPAMSATENSAALNEIQKLYELRHPNITYLFDAFYYEGAAYLVIERCASSLAALIAINNYNFLVWTKPVARCLLQAVSWIHQNKFVHMDIHLRNVLYTFTRDELDGEERSMTFKVADLGIAQLQQDCRPENVMAEWIRPPEAIVSDEFGPMDHRVDLYHCGLVLLQMIRGEELRFSREEILAGAPRDAALALPPPYSFAIEKALRRHVQYRTASAKELWRDMNTAAGARTA